MDRVRRRHPLRDLILAAIVLSLLGLPLEGRRVLADQPSAEPPSSSKAREAEEQSLPSAPELIRVPRPSSHLSRFNSGASSSSLATPAPGSSGWWLSSVGITLVLVVCGALCVAARKYRPQGSTGLVQVVGRVSLSPRHSIFLVRAGPRVLLIGTGAQGAPALLGELTGTSEPDRAPVASSMPGVDLRLGDEE